MVCINVALIGFYLADNAWGESISVSPSLRLGEQLDTNVFMSGEGGYIRSDTITEISPRISISSLTKGVTLEGAYSLALARYRRFKELDSLSHMASVDGEINIWKRTALVFGDSFTLARDALKTKTREDQEGLTDTGPEIEEPADIASNIGFLSKRTDIVYNTAFVSLSHQLSDNGDFRLLLSDHRLDFKDPNFYDTRSNSAELSGNYKWRPETMINLSYKFNNYHFESETGKNDIASHAVELGLTEKLSASSSVNVSAGVVRTPGAGKTLDWTAAMKVAKTFEVSSLRLSYARKVANSAGLTNDVNINESISIGWNRTISNSLGMNAGGTLIKNRSKSSDSLDITFYTLDAGFTWRAKGWLTVSASYSRFQQWIKAGPGVNTTRDQYFLNFTATAGEWRL